MQVESQVAEQQMESKEQTRVTQLGETGGASHPEASGPPVAHCE